MTCVRVMCPFCGRVQDVLVYDEDYSNWTQGMLAQEAFPYLTAAERELLISGICDDCWGDLFEEDDEECAK